MVDAGEQTIVLRSVSFSHPNDTNENDLVEHLLLTEKITHHFDFSGFSQLTTIRVSEKIDGTNYRQLSEKEFPTDFEANNTAVIIVLDGAAQDMKITLQSAVAEGSATTVPGTTRDEIRQ